MAQEGLLSGLAWDVLEEAAAHMGTPWLPEPLETLCAGLQIRPCPKGARVAYNIYDMNASKLRAFVLNITLWHGRKT